MWKRLLKFLRRLMMVLFAFGLLAFFLPRLITTIAAWTKIYQVENAPTVRVAIIFGAGLTRSGYPTPILRDRVETGVQLYFAGKVQKLLMSGDNRSPGHDEPGSMRDYAVGLGVPADAIVLDNSGDRTYDTCYRARAIFGLNSALLVTQSFHLPRALFLCRALGLNAIGVEANNRHYWPLSLFIWNLREQFATMAAFVDVYFSKPVPALGEPQPIFPKSS